MLKFNGKDPIGKLIWDYQQGEKDARIEVYANLSDPDYITGKHLFRNYKEMPKLEQKALELAEGKILDVGAASGCHSINLHSKGKDVECIDISPGAVAWLQHFGLKAQQTDFFDFTYPGQFDSILMLMNGIGICGEIYELGRFFLKADELLKPGGQLIFDSSDLQYIFHETNEKILEALSPHYYGEVIYQMEYKDQRTRPFPWLFIDYQTMKEWAEAYGFKCEFIANGEHFDYLARLVKK
ncbi:MAG: class I SAM-dependent methyltransferase [Chitinophagales bacterium]